MQVIIDIIKIPVILINFIKIFLRKTKFQSQNF